MQIFSVGEKQFYRDGRLIRICGLYNSWYESVEDPEAIVKSLKKLKPRLHIFTFFQRPPHVEPRYDYHMEPYSVSVINITSYDNWWNNSIGKKTRYLVNRAEKSGVDVRVSEFDDEFVKGITAIYNETPIRQGKEFPHYKVTSEEVRKGNSTFIDRSVFLGAYHQNEIIGFANIVFEEEFADVLQLLSKIAHRDKATTNALLAKAVDLCASRGTGYLAYGDWNEGSLSDFKRHNGFVKMDLPRYYIPLNWTGAVALKLKLHRPFSELLPAKAIPLLKDLRLKWHKLKVKA
ncbi:MAG: hypothetical protein ACLP9S_15370 [Syntrophales bacterium]